MTARLLASSLLAGVLAAVPVGAATTSPASAAPSTAGAPTADVATTQVASAGRLRPGARDRRIVSKPVTIPVRNTNGTTVACTSDGAAYRLQGRLVGRRAAVLGRSGAQRVNVLVHDFAAGSWTWQLPGHRTRDYARKLARAGEVSLVLDRLGYGASPLADGRATCLGAQAGMLHQVVQHLRSGNYHFTSDTRRQPLHAARVVVHGHAVGAAVAQLEAAEFDDVDGLVLMSWADSGASSRAVQESRQQSATCLDGRGYATYGGTPQEYRSLVFRAAPAAVQEAATARRSADPCGDVLSLGRAVAASGRSARQVDAPVLLLHGSEDVLLRRGAAAEQARSYAADVPVTTRTVAGAGHALPLEAPREVRRAVIGWLRAQR